MSKPALSTLALAAGALLAVQPLCAQEEQPTPAPAAAAPRPDTDTLLKKTNGLIDLLQCVENKEEADIVAPEVKSRWEELSALMDALGDDIPPALLEASMVLSQTIAEMDYRSNWFGSKALRDVFMVEDDPDDVAVVEDTPLSTDQEQAYSSAVGALLAHAADATALLRSIHDKAGADAAAPQLADILRQFVDTVDALQSRGDYSPAVDRFLKANYPDAEKTLFDFAQAVTDVQDADYFDSENLARALEILVD